MAFSDQQFGQELFLYLFPSGKIHRCSTLALPLPREQGFNFKKDAETASLKEPAPQKKKVFHNRSLRRQSGPVKTKHSVGVPYLQAQPAVGPWERST